MARVDIPQKTRPSGGGKRRIATLLVVVGLLYAAGLIGLFAYSSGFKLNAFLFGTEGGEADAALSADGASGIELTLNPPENEKKLPPLDDAPPQDATLSPDFPLDSIHTALERSTETTKAAEPDIKPIPIAGVRFTSRIAPIKCWDQRGFEYRAAECDTLGELALLAEHHLDMIESCRTETTNAGNTGRFALFAEADFVRNRFSIWPGTASTLRDADKIADCVTDRWRALPFTSVSHRFSRYRMKGVVQFEGVRLPSSSPIAITPSRSVELEKAAADAKEVTVSRDRVRVRKSPVSGEIIGFISTGQRVKLIEVTDEWCLIKTKRGNLGWMICWGLDLQQQQEAPKQNGQHQPAPESK